MTHIAMLLQYENYFFSIVTAWSGMKKSGPQIKSGIDKLL